MGFLSSILSPLASVAGGLIGGPAGAAIGGALGGALSGKGGGSTQSGTQTVTQQQQLDPRIASMLFGSNGNNGLLSQYQQLGQQPQSAGSAQFGQASQNFLGGQGGGILNQLQSGASNLANSSIQAPQSQAAQSVSSQTPNAPGLVRGIRSDAASINAPSQNSIDLSGAFGRFIGEDAGANPYLTRALQAGVDQTTSAFQKNQNDLTNNLQRNVLGGIRSNSVLAGQYGGSRQGVAEGNAISDYTNQLTSANLQLGQANSANTLGAQAQAFNQGQDRSLAALQGLSNQQYNTAGQNAGFQQQANLQYGANQQDAAKTNQAMLLNNNQFNAGQQQQTNLANQAAQQQTNLANQSAQQGANSLNSANQTTGLGALSGLLGNAYGYAQNQDNYALNRAGQTNSLLAPYLSANSSTSTNTPLYSNPGGNILGGAAAGLGLYNQFAGLGGSSGGNTGYNTFNVSPGTAPVNTAALQDLSWLNNIGR